MFMKMQFVSRKKNAAGFWAKPVWAGLCLMLLGLPARGGNGAGSLVDYADPMVGTDRDGHVYPGATVPFGFVQVSPDTPGISGDWCSGYHYSATMICGFLMNHLSGTGCPDLGNVLLLPTVGEFKMPLTDGCRTRFSHDQEYTRPGLYRVCLPEFGVKAELTATTRVGFQRYTFPKTDKAHVLLDLWHGLGNHAAEALLTVENDHTVSGFRKAYSDSCFSEAGLKEYYFVAEFSKPFAGSAICLEGRSVEGKEARGSNVTARLDYATRSNETVVIRVALSSVSVEGARRNLRAEAATWDFDAVAAAAKKRWHEALGKIQIESTDAEFKKTFYTALYHTQLTPIVFSDVDGQFRGPDGQVHRTGGFDYYTDLSLWDTFRAEQPLLTLVQPGRANDMVKTMLAHYDILGQHMLPLEVFGGRESYCMIGNPSIPVIAEAYAKGLRDWDARRALAAMIETSEREDETHASSEGYNLYRRQHWIPSRPYDGASSLPCQSVSKLLEFAYDDACLARFAFSLGKKGVADKYARRSTNWISVFDPATGFMRGRNRDGSWVEPFDPKRFTFADYTEANAWQYTFFVPHNVPGLIQAMGGDERFVAKLDEFFATPEKMPEVSWLMDGVVGMYWHGNEPCHNFSYLYNYAGQPWKTQSRVRQIARAFYQNSPGGMCGNDDCGQMSAWYVFTALGFYPADPPTGIYVIGSPLVDKATLKLDRKFCRGGAFTVIAKHNSLRNQFIQSATLNGQPLTRSWISHQEIAAGGELVLSMGPVPNCAWGAATTDRPTQTLIP